MKAVFVVILVLIGSAYCRSLPAVAAPVPSDSIDVGSLNGNPVALVRKARQFGNISTNIFYLKGCTNEFIFQVFTIITILTRITIPQTIMITTHSMILVVDFTITLTSIHLMIHQTIMTEILTMILVSLERSSF